MSAPAQDAAATPARPVPAQRWANRLRIVALALVLGAAGLFVGLKIGASLKSSGSAGLGLETWQKSALLAICLTTMLFVLLAHELGHLFGGRLVGFRAFLLVVGPLRLERTGRGWSAHLNKDIGLFGGLAGTAAVDARDLARRTAIMVAAGPAVSLTIGVAAALAAWSLELLPLDRASPFSDVLLFFGLLFTAGMSSAIGVATLVPMSTSGYLSDGARLVRLLRGGPVAARDSAIQALMGSSLSGVRPRDWDADLLREARALSDGSVFEFTSWQFLQAHAADSGNAIESLRLLRHLLQHVDRMPPSLTAVIHFDAARQLALAGELTEARTQFALARGSVIGAPYLKPFAQAALLAADGRVTEAAGLVPAIRTLLDQSIDRGGARWLADSLDVLQRATVPGQTT